MKRKKSEPDTARVSKLGMAESGDGVNKSVESSEDKFSQEDIKANHQVSKEETRVNEVDDRTGRHRLHNAAAEGNMEVVNMLLNKDWIDVNVQVVPGKCSEDCSKDCDCDLPKRYSYEGWTALHFAAHQGHVKVVQRILEVYNVDPNVQDFSMGDTPLHIAAWWGQTATVEELLTVGSEQKTQVNVNVVNKEGQTALHKAASESPDISKYLVYEELPKRWQRPQWMRPPEKFHYKFLHRMKSRVVKNGHRLQRTTHPKEGVNAKVVEKLLKREDIKLTLEDMEGRTALDIASEERNWKVFQLLRLKITREVADYNEPYYRDRQASVDAANAILLGAALIASVTFAAWLQPPLGYTTDYQIQYTDNFPAPPSNPQFVSVEHHPLLEWFWAFNSLSFYCAIATVVSGAHSVLPSRNLTIKQGVAKLSRNLLLTSTLLALSMLSVLFAFAIAGIVVLPPLLKYRANIATTVGIGGGLCLVLLVRLGANIVKLSHE